MNEALKKPPYSEAAETSYSVRALQEVGRIVTFGVLEEPWTNIDIREFPGHREIDLGPTLGRVRHPMGENRMVWVGGVLAWDPERYEVKAEMLDDEQKVEEVLPMQQAYMDEDWEVQLTTPDRVVGIRELI
jgi:hypothetical protein